MRWFALLLIGCAAPDRADVDPTLGRFGPDYPLVEIADFTAPTYTTIDAQLRADLDGDGLEDLALRLRGLEYGGGSAGSIVVVPGPLTGPQGVGDATAAVAMPPEASAAGSIAADTDGDGLTELLVVARDPEFAVGRFEPPLVGNRDLLAAETLVLFDDGCAYGVAVCGDVDGDGIADVLTHCEGAWGVLPLAPGAWDGAELVTPLFAGGLPIPDLTGDGRVDAIWVVAGDDGTEQLLVPSPLSPDSGPDDAIAWYTGGAYGRQTVGDIDGDGVSELAQLGEDGEWLLFTDPRGELTRDAARLVLKDPGGLVDGAILAAGDVSGDGFPDLVGTTSHWPDPPEGSYYGVPGPGALWIAMGPLSGAVEVELAWTPPEDFEVRDVSAGDLDADGRVDLGIRLRAMSTDDDRLVILQRQ